jgi:phosphatidylserine decarboxylase
MLSRLWGSVCELELPVKFREPIYGAWINAFKCDMTDVLEKDLTKYQNMQEFFIRKLHGAARPIDPDHDLISPVDGTVLAFGKIDKSTGLSISKVKGVKFSLKSLIGKPSSSNSVKDHSDEKDLGSYFCTIYLSPAEYH